MPLSIDVICDRCNKRVGEARISVALQNYHNPGNFASHTRGVVIDRDDMDYLSAEHTSKICNAEVAHQQTLAALRPVVAPAEE